MPILFVGIKYQNLWGHDRLLSVIHLLVELVFARILYLQMLGIAKKKKKRKVDRNLSQI